MESYRGQTIPDSPGFAVPALAISGRMIWQLPRAQAAEGIT